ncbi:MAG: zinc-binding dehydrogenase [Sorangiineae bacterium]|nr:zinc-binding dehydrogenase [Polyangiaceae bacterium]MEB2323647.1 zinc-binding dehydrogenase [Sorangiineae bacterium]
MRALVIVEPGRPLELRDLPRPEPGPGELLVQVEAAGICHSDAHYRDGTGNLTRLPLIPGHEIAGKVVGLGSEHRGIPLGARVALHYLVTCGRCERCARGLEQFCDEVAMLGKDLPGGYAEYVVAPAANAVRLPDLLDPAEAAVMMCSTATALHALDKARLRPGETVAVFGAGGLGQSAVKLARVLGASAVYAVEVAPAKRAAAARSGAITIDPADGPPERQIRELTRGRGVDVALELVGLPLTAEQAVAAVGVQGRVALAGLSREPFRVRSYPDVLGRELELIGVSDHRREELDRLMELARTGALELGSVVAERLPLEADAVNERLDALASFRGATRSVITP